MLGKDEEGLLDWEIRFYKNFFIGTVTFILLAGALLFYLRAQPKPQEPTTSGTFYMKFGGAVCGEHYIDGCGVHLRKCDNLKEYHCMHDVSLDLDVKN